MPYTTMKVKATHNVPYTINFSDDFMTGHSPCQLKHDDRTEVSSTSPGRIAENLWFYFRQGQGISSRP